MTRAECAYASLTRNACFTRRSLAFDKRHFILSEAAGTYTDAVGWHAPAPSSSRNQLTGLVKWYNLVSVKRAISLITWDSRF